MIFNKIILMICAIVFLHSFRFIKRKSLKDNFERLLDFDLSYDFINLFFLSFIFFIFSLYEFSRYFYYNTDIIQINFITYIKIITAYILLNMFFPVIVFKKRNNYISTFIGNLFFTVGLILTIILEYDDLISFNVYFNMDLFYSCALGLCAYFLTILFHLLFSNKFVNLIILGLALPILLMIIENLEMRITALVMMIFVIIYFIFSKNVFLRRLIFLIIYPLCFIYAAIINFNLYEIVTAYIINYKETAIILSGFILFHFILLNIKNSKKFHICFFFIVTIPTLIYLTLRVLKFDFLLLNNYQFLISIVIYYILTIIMLFIMEKHWFYPILFYLTLIILLFISCFVVLEHSEIDNYTYIVISSYLVTLIFYLFRQYKKQKFIIKQIIKLVAGKKIDIETVKFKSAKKIYNIFNNIIKENVYCQYDFTSELKNIHF